MVVVRMVRWMWIAVCGCAGTGIESWRGWIIGEVSLSVVLEAMAEKAAVNVVVVVVLREWRRCRLRQGSGRIKVLPW